MLIVLFTNTGDNTIFYSSLFKVEWVKFIICFKMNVCSKYYLSFSTLQHQRLSFLFLPPISLKDFLHFSRDLASKDERGRGRERPHTTSLSSKKRVCVKLRVDNLAFFMVNGRQLSHSQFVHFEPVAPQAAKLTNNFY